MPGGITDEGKNLVMNAIFGGGSVPGTWYIGLARTMPSDETTAGSVNEVSGGGYARIAVPNNGTYWKSSENGTATNLLAIEWSVATADWGSVIAALLFTAASAGTLVAWAALNSGRNIVEGSGVSFGPDLLTFNINTSR